MIRIPLTPYLDLKEAKTEGTIPRWNVVCNCGCGNGIKLGEDEIELVYNAVKAEQGKRQ